MTEMLPSFATPSNRAEKQQDNTIFSRKIFFCWRFLSPISVCAEEVARQMSASRMPRFPVVKGAQDLLRGFDAVVFNELSLEAYVI